MSLILAFSREVRDRESPIVCPAWLPPSSPPPCRSSSFTLGYLTEGRRARRRRLDDEALSAAIAFLAASGKRRRQLGVLNSMTKRLSLVDTDIFSLDAPPAHVSEALRRYTLILDEYSEAEARVRFLLPKSLHRDLRDINEQHSDLRSQIGKPDFDSESHGLATAMSSWTDRAVADLR